MYNPNPEIRNSISNEKIQPAKKRVIIRQKRSDEALSYIIISRYTIRFYFFRNTTRNHVPAVRYTHQTTAQRAGDMNFFRNGKPIRTEEDMRPSTSNSQRMIVVGGGAGAAPEQNSMRKERQYIIKG